MDREYSFFKQLTPRDTEKVPPKRHHESQPSSLRSTSSFLSSRASLDTLPSPHPLFSDAARGGVFFGVAGSHVVLPCQADPTFAAYPYSPRALLRAARRSWLTTSGESYRASPRVRACARPPGRCEFDIFILLE